MKIPLDVIEVLEPIYKKNKHLLTKADTAEYYSVIHKKYDSFYFIVEGKAIGYKETFLVQRCPSSSNTVKATTVGVSKQELSIFFCEWIEWIKIYDSYGIDPNNTINQTNKIMDTENKKVFIVHGRDDVLKEKVAGFVGRELKLEAILLSEQANTSKTIIEKIEKNTDVDFAIVLYTPCDEGRLKNVKKGVKAQIRDRARQNVVFEHGYLMGKLGRKKVIMMYDENIELPSDITGIAYSSPTKDWKFELVKEFKAMGYSI